MERNEIKIKWPALFGEIKGLKTDCENRIIVEREVIPIIFVPGAMGSRLKFTKSPVKKPTAWDPDDPLFMIGTYRKDLCSPFKRKTLIVGKSFSPSHLEVDNHDEKHNKIFHHGTDFSRAARGWGGVMWDSYGGLIKELQRRKWGDPIGNCFEFPVYAFGYNWTDSIRESGRKLKERIDEIKDYFCNQKKRMCKYVILITHSMGGIVARSACELHGAEKDIIGIIHGAQPVTGAASAYWRIKAGFERPNIRLWEWLSSPKKAIGAKVAPDILGGEGEAVTCILGNIPGGLELLPNKDYGSGWLKCPGADGSVKSLPVSDPYSEIYKIKEDVYYRLVKPEWLDPRPTEADIASGNPAAVEYMKTHNISQSFGNGQRNPSKGSWGGYEVRINKAAQFHTDLGLKRHPTSYNIFISKLPTTADDIKFRLETVTGGMNDYWTFDRSGSYSDYITGDMRLAAPGSGQFIVRLEQPSGMGDGTVPNDAASALKIDEKRTRNIEKGSVLFYNHQDLYKTLEAQEAVFIAVKNLAKQRIREEAPE